MKFFLVLTLGAVIGAFGMKYHDDAKFAAQTNSHISSGISSASTAAQNALSSAQK